MLSSRSLTMLTTNGEIVWQPEPVCEQRVGILSTHSKKQFSWTRSCRWWRWAL